LLKAETGFGFYKEHPGSEQYHIYPPINIRTYLNAYFGNRVHKVYIGLGFDFNFSSHPMSLIIPIGYQVTFTKRFFMKVSYNQYLMSFVSNVDEPAYAEWIWDSDTFMFLLNIGAGIHF